MGYRDYSILSTHRCMFSTWPDSDRTVRKRETDTWEGEASSVVFHVQNCGQGDGWRRDTVNIVSHKGKS